MSYLRAVLRTLFNETNLLPYSIIDKVHGEFI